MGALDAFESTWSKARQNFGEGTPTDGSQFDQSNALRESQASTQSAKPGSQWTGTASDAYSAANDKQAQALGRYAELDQRLKSEIDRSAAVVNVGRENLDAVRQWVYDAASSLPPSANKDQLMYQIVSQGSGQIAEIIQQSNGDMNEISARLTALGTEWQAAGGQGELPEGTPEDGEEIPEDIAAQAEADVQAALSGDQAAAERVQLVFNGISDPQLAGTEPLDATEQAYLSQMQAQQHGMSVDDLQTAENNGIKGLLSDSWQLMSNPKLQYPQTPYEVNALQSDKMTQGGFDKLPQSMQSAITSGGIENSGEIAKIADMVNNGNPHFQTNTDLDRGLVHKVSDMMASPDWRENASHFSHDAVQQAAADTLEAVSHDHQVLHDALTGKVEDGNQYREQFKVNNHDFMYNLTHEEWNDNGAAAASVFDWTEQAAVPGSGEEEIAGAAAHAYADFIGNPEMREDLLHLKGDTMPGLAGEHTLGAVNPLLVQGMSTGLTPYVTDLAGLSGDNPFFEPIDTVGSQQDGTMPGAKGVFAVLNTDDIAGQTINAEAYEQAVLREAAFAQDPKAAGAEGHLFSSATLRGLVDVGVHEAFQSAAENDYKIAQTEYDWKKAGYSLGVDAASTAGGFVPGVGQVAGPVIGQVGNAMESQLLGEAPDAPVENPLTDMTTVNSGEYILNAMLAAGQTPELPQGYINDKDPNHRFIEQPAGVGSDEYYRAVVGAVTQATGPSETGIAPTETYSDRYDNVTDDPDPPPPPGQG
ncbi:EspA/EspE family type VII secretion system effector [Mycobacterium sp. CPCC 205372]|uniref:EspA/EspE family type VII secretion system effector n=1 Tax=Mycobacterium hippophais TaxID=3016340 RepID=A0ABT4PP04_9MYCO|nr:EspA/EspE family type VII secretion system effector [Mycobacterium hippophais]MCZ8378287.1 EspA/EspE family type VII secretion system effector [Mycobacterium hippophais]